jgi:hypothetical protein
MVDLLDACVKNLQHQGMKRMFMDGVAGGLEELKWLGESLSTVGVPFWQQLINTGFEEWARYRDVYVYLSTRVFLPRVL